MIIPEKYVNFTYIIYDINDVNTDIIKNKNELFDLILKYHFPCSMNIHTQTLLSTEEKQEIIDNEVLLFGKKLNEFNNHNNTTYSFYQMPRTLYDLLVISYYLSLDINERLNVPYFVLGTDMIYFDYEMYCSKVDEYNKQINNFFWSVNNFIHKFIISEIKTTPPLNYLYCLRIFEILITKCKTKHKELLKDPVDKFLKLVQKIIKDDTLFSDDYIDFNKGLKLDQAKNFIIKYYPEYVNMEKPLKDMFDAINDVLIHVFEEKYFTKEDKYGRILVKLNNQEFIKIAYLTKTLSTNDENLDIISFIDFSSEKETNILRHTLQYELGINTVNNDSVVTLYRGSSDLIENVVDKRNQNRGYSVSYNLSILGGIFYDKTACTYNYMLGEYKLEDVNIPITKEQDNFNFKTRYRIKKHNYNDNSISGNLFFIPPLHPLIQLLSLGEYWHPRSKIFKNSEIKGIQAFNYFYDDYDSVNKFPDYLISSYEKDEMEKKYNLFMKQNRKEVLTKEGDDNIALTLFGGSSYYDKYLKYKRKYIGLKK